MVADLPPPMPVVAEVRLFDPFASLGPFLAMQAVEEAAQQPVEAEEAERDPLAEPDTGIIDGRRRPGYQPRLPDKVSQENIGAVRPPPPEAFPTEEFPIPDRWRLVETLGLVKERWYDPYNQNTYKGDRPINPAKVPWLPIKGKDWFIVASAVSDTVVEARTFPIPVGVQTTERPGDIDVFGKDGSEVYSQTFIVGAALIKGMTAYKPPDIEYRVTLALNANYVNVPEKRVLFVEPSKPSRRFDHFLGVQELFLDYHIRNTSDRFDFESIRVGIQPFQSDFRGFLFNDQQLGIRYFGNRDNNRWQYNLAAFWRLEKDTNSGLNSVVQRPRNDWLFIANLYRQDLPVPGLTSQITVVYNMNRERDRIEIDDNGFPVRPALLGTLRGREYDVAYLGYSADGRIGRINLSASIYAALGTDRASFFTDRNAKSARALPLRRRATTSTGCASVCPGYTPAATMIRSTIRKRASMRSSKTRFLPVPIRATGFARRYPLPAVAARSASTDATAY